MKKIILYMFMVLMLVGSVLGASMTRNLPNSLSAGSQFTVTYSATSTDAKYGVVWEDTVGGGCTPSSYKGAIIKSEGDSQTQTKSVTYTAPSSGSCTFSGGYDFADSDQGTFPTKTISIAGGCTITDEQASYKCDGDNIYYFDNCGNKKLVKETCDDGCTNGASACKTGTGDDPTTTQTFEFGKCISGEAETLEFGDALFNFDCFRIVHIILIVVALIIFSFLK